MKGGRARTPVGPPRAPAMLSRALLLVCLVAGTSQLSIPVFEVPVSLEVGNDAELRCQFVIDARDTWAPYVKWWWTPLYDLEKTQKLVYQRLGANDATVLGQHHNVVAGQNDTLIIKDAQVANSGKYECEVSGTTEIRLHQRMIVFSNGTGPELNVSLAEDGPDDDAEEDVRLECNAADVSPEPLLIIYINGNEIVNATGEPLSDATGFYNVSAAVTVSKVEVDGADIRCELLYTNADIAHPLYVDTETFNPTGAVLSTTESAEDAGQSEATSDSLQNHNSGSREVISWLVLAISAASAMLVATSQ